MTTPAPPPAALAPVASARPRSPADLFVTYCAISMQAFGGSLALTERTLVHHKRWFTPHEFLGLYAISQVLPGPTGVSFCVLVGDRFFGVRGAAAALAGFMVLPSATVLVLATLFQQYQHLPAVQGALNGMGAAAVGLIVHTAARMSRTLRGQHLGVAVALATFGAVALAGWSVRTVVLTLGVASVAWAWHQLGRRP
jgi:chromate transporter